MTQLGLQLYSVKEDVAEDFFGTLAKVAEIGYDGVEFAGYKDVAAPDLKAVLDDYGLVAAGTHVGVQALENDLENQIADAKAIDCPALLCPGFWGMDKTVALFQRMADLFNHVGEHCKAAGLGFFYHIHGHEFVQFDDQSGMDILLENTDPALVGFEPDTYWIERVGVNALDFVQKHGARCGYIHLKDTKDRDEWLDAEIGDGLIDIADIIKAAAQFDVAWFIVEQEYFEMPRLESVAISLQNVRQMMA